MSGKNPVRIIQSSYKQQVMFFLRQSKIPPENPVPGFGRHFCYNPF